MKVSRHMHVLSSCRLFLVSAHARMKSVLCVNGPGAVPFLMLRNARIVESRLMGCCCVWGLLLFDLFLVVLVVCCVCSGCIGSDVGDGKLMRSGHRFLISSDVSSVMVAVGMHDCMRWLATPQLSASAATWAEWERVVALSNDGGVTDGAVCLSRSNASPHEAMMSPLLNCRVRACAVRLQLANFCCFGGGKRMRASNVKSSFQRGSLARIVGGVDVLVVWVGRW